MDVIGRVTSARLMHIGDGDVHGRGLGVHVGSERVAGISSARTQKYSSLLRGFSRWHLRFSRIESSSFSRAELSDDSRSLKNPSTLDHPEALSSSAGDFSVGCGKRTEPDRPEKLKLLVQRASAEMSACPSSFSFSNFSMSASASVFGNSPSRAWMHRHVADAPGRWQSRVPTPDRRWAAKLTIVEVVESRHERQIASRTTRARRNKSSRTVPADERDRGRPHGTAACAASA